MAMEKTTKQSWEEYFVSGSILNVQKDGTETIVLATSEIEAIDSEGNDALATVIDMTTKKLDNDPNGSYTNNLLSVRCRAGVETSSPYVITFKMITTEGNKWEVDMKLVIKEVPAS